MKQIMLAAMVLLFADLANAAATCSDLAVEGASRIYSLNDGAGAITSTQVKVNPNSTSNGVSLIVTINNQSYLVALTASAPSGNTSLGCKSVDYVIASPYDRLISQ